MTNELENVCSQLRKNMKTDCNDESNKDECDNLINQLSQSIDELSDNQLGNKLNILIPTILDAINHFELKQRGVLLIDQLIEKLDHQFFVKQGYDNLIIFTLKNQFYHQELELSKILFTVCENALIKFNFQSIDTNKIVTELDEIVDIVLNSIEIGTDDNIRLICLEELPRLLVLLEKAVYKHLNRLIDNFVYIVDADFITARPKQIKACLSMLNQLIKLTKDKFDITRPLITLIKLLFSLNELKSEHNNEFKDKEFQSIHNETINSLKMIYAVDSASFKTYLNELETNSDLKPIYDLILNDLKIIINDS